MKKYVIPSSISLLLLIIAFFWLAPIDLTSGTNDHSALERSEVIKLPEVDSSADFPLQKAIEDRRSVRDFRDTALDLEDVSELAWSLQGITSPSMGGRTAPSAGALYPLEVYVAVSRQVEGLDAGVYRYIPEEHGLFVCSDEKVNQELASAALGQSFIAEAPLVLIISGNYSVTTSKYGKRGIRYVHMEAGHAAQNVYLKVEALDLGTVSVGAFFDDKVKHTLDLPSEQTPLYLMPVGAK